MRYFMNLGGCWNGGIDDVRDCMTRVLVTVPLSALASLLPLWAGLEVLAFLPLSILNKLN